MKLLILFQIVALTDFKFGKCENPSDGLISRDDVRAEASVGRNNSTADGQDPSEFFDVVKDDATNYDKSNLNFDYDQEEEEEVLDTRQQENSFPEKQMQEALLKAMKKPAIRKQIGEVIPILRVMSPAQRLTLAALVSSQIMSRNALSESSLTEVAKLFGGKNLESVEERNNVTEYLLLPISMDIAKMFRGIGREVGRNFRENFYLEKAEPERKKSRRRKTRKPSLGIKSSPPPPPPPPTRHLRQPNAKRRIDGIEYYVFEEEFEKVPINRTDSNFYRQPGKEDCDFFTKSLCLEVANYPAEAIISSLRKNADIAKTFLADFDVKSVDEFGFSEKKNRPRGRRVEGFETFERRRDEKNEVLNGGGGGGGGEENNFMCPSIVKYARPKRARTTSGKWKYIVNAGDYTQTLRLEICMKPNAPCSYVTNHLNSECSQVFNYHRLLSWDENQGLHMDVFKVPSCCSCHVQGYSNFYPPGQGYSFAEKRKEPVTVPSEITPLPSPPSPPPVHESPVYKVQNIRNNIEIPNVIPLKNVAASLPNSQKPKVVYHQKVREYMKNPAEHLVPPGPPLPLENEGNFQTTYEPHLYDKKGSYKFSNPSQNLRYSTVTENGQTTDVPNEKNDFRTKHRKVTKPHTRFNTPNPSQVNTPGPPIVISNTHHQVALPPSHFETNPTFEQTGQIHYVIPLVNRPLPLANAENKKVNIKDTVLYTASGPPTNLPNRDYKFQSGLGANLRSPPHYYNREYSDSQGVPSRLNPFYITPPKEIVAAATTTTTTTSTTTAPPIPEKSEIITASGHKKINYNYHPIIDFFRPETVKKKQPVYPISRLGVSSQDWTPIMGQ